MIQNSHLKYLQNNTDNFQIVSSLSESANYLIENNKMKISTKKTNNYYNVIVYLKDGLKYRRASKNFTSFNQDDLKHLISVAKSSDVLNYFHGLPKKSKYKSLNYDKNIFDISKVKDHFDIILSECNDVNLSSGKVSTSMTKSRIINSNGIDHESIDTGYYAYIDLVRKSNYGDYIDSSFIPKSNKITKLCSMTKSKLFDFENTKKLKQTNLPVILNQDVLSSLLDYTLLPNFMGYNIENKKSFLNFNSIGTQLLKNKINIIDNPILKDSPYNDSIDFEGNKTLKTNIVKDGVFTNALTDFNLSKEYGIKNTASSTSLSSVDFSNVLIDGESTDYKKAIIVESVLGAHTSNSTTTDFSVNVDKAYFYDNGKLSPVSDFFISGKMLDVLNAAKFVNESKRRSNFKSKDLISKNIKIVN